MQNQEIDKKIKIVFWSKFIFVQYIDPEMSTTVDKC